jgi:hypothetical protein
MKLLLNGCSYSANYYLIHNLASELGCDVATSIAHGGSSNRRIIRSTVEYIEQHSDVGFVLLGLSFARRQEGSFLPIDATDNWVQYSANGMQGAYAPPGSQFKNDADKLNIEQFIQDEYAYNIDLKHIDQLLCDLLMLAGYLDNRNIRYLFFNFCERRYGEYFASIGTRYASAIQANPRIVPLDKFIANMFFHELGAEFAEPEARWEPFARHYNGNEYHHLNEYLLNHLKLNNLT